VRIFITGMGGFLGRSLAGHLKARGHHVSGSTRREMELGHPFDSTVFEQQDSVIHCAHDFTPGAHPYNVAGTKAWMMTAAQLGVPHQIFLSSYSARADAASEYGRTKHEIERLFLDSGYAVLRPGLVTGAGGLYRRQRKLLLRSPVVPMLGAGTQPVATVSLEHFLAAATLVLEERHAGAFNLFYEPMPTYRQFVSGVRQGKRTLFLQVPIGLALTLASLAEWLHLPLPFKPGQIRALKENQTSPWRSDLSALLPIAEAPVDYRFPPPD
jgi:nucleoside-diphosphate-sugar epimerase